MTNFERWDKEFRAQRLYAFNHNEDALLWLKTRAVCRSRQLRPFLVENSISLTSTKLAEQNAELFALLENTPGAIRMLDDYLRVRHNDWYVSMGIDEEKLKNDLYRIRNYEWGGDRNNSLDKHLVSKYVKPISSYDELSARKMEIEGNAWNYVQTSWYNNWTSFLIESLFKRHERVVSAIGEIKSVDFFIDDVPIDLKVTFMPSQFIGEKLKRKLGKRELPWLKAQAKTVGIKVDPSMSYAQQMYVITERLAEQGHTDILDMLAVKRREVVREAEEDATELMSWLYTNQGEMRFGAENRLFIVLADTSDLSQSWKMKRAFSLIEPKVTEYLNKFCDDTLKEVTFTFNKETYKSLADIIFITKE
ncbi:MAG: hypothetical protein LUC86_03845 [Prevotellaceae bacterium]|nr:hypothetical protein [Prevotellaceae bacterium]MCD8303942.1 hypothetical protein [Prevotellaceae bacterium]